MKQCEAIKPDGSQCRSFAIKGTEPPRCVFHVEKNTLKAREPVWTLRRRIEALDKELSALIRIKDVATRVRLRLDLLSRMSQLEGELRASEQPKALTSAERLKKIESELGR